MLSAYETNTNPILCMIVKIIKMCLIRVYQKYFDSTDLYIKIISYTNLKTIYNFTILLFWRQHPTKQQLYSHQPPITKTIQIRWTRHPGHCWRSRDKLISDVLLWTPLHGRAKAGWPARTYIQQLCEDIVCSPEDLLEAMNNRDRCR